MSEISGGSAENDEMNTPETGGETGQTGSGGTEGLAGGNLESVQLDEGSDHVVRDQVLRQIDPQVTGGLGEPLRPLRVGRERLA